MKENDIFRRNLLAAMNEAKLSAAALSRKAGMNARLVTDIAEGRSASPKMSTVFALSKALGKDPGEMMGLVLTFMRSLFASLSDTAKPIKHVF